MYEHALPFPPDGKNHSLWKAAQQTLLTDPLHGPSRHTTSTAMRLAAGHAFTSTYARRFRKDIPEELNSCECGFSDRTWDHLIWDCVRYPSARRKADPYSDWNRHSPSYLFCDSFGAQIFLAFLQASRAAFKPFTSPVVHAFDPG